MIRYLLVIVKAPNFYTLTVIVEKTGKMRFVKYTSTKDEENTYEVEKE